MRGCSGCQAKVFLRGGRNPCSVEVRVGFQGDDVEDGGGTCGVNAELAFESTPFGDLKLCLEILQAL